MALYHEQFRSLPDSALAQREFLFKAFDRLVDLQVEGLDNFSALDPQRPTLIAFYPHWGHPDSPIVRQSVPTIMRDSLFFPVPTDYWKTSKLREKASQAFFNTVPLSDCTQSHGLPTDAIKDIIYLMQEGWIPVISPEGTRAKPNGQPVPIKDGIAMIAMQTNCQIMPIILDGHQDFMPKGALVPKPFTGVSIRGLSKRLITTKWLLPLTFDDERQIKPRKKARHKITGILEQTFTNST